VLDLSDGPSTNSPQALECVVSCSAWAGGTPWQSAQLSHSCITDTQLAWSDVVAWLLPATAEYKECSCTVVVARTVGGYLRTAEVGVAVPWVACKPCGTLGEHHWNYLQRILAWSTSSPQPLHMPS
jgi:hypothetical protein